MKFSIVFTITVMLPSRPALGPTQPPVQCVSGLSRGKERPKRDAEHLRPSSAVVMKE
jgi:hypothetical protein